MRIAIGEITLMVTVFFMGYGHAYAGVVDCTSIPTVNVSHFVTHNNQYGGHLNAHVLGQTPPAGYTQAGKTIFRDDGDWMSAYEVLSNQVPALQCNTDAGVGAEAARTLPIQYFSYQCTAADASGKCTSGNEVQTNHVTFVFRVVPYESKKIWIVYTSYPTPQ